MTPTSESPRAARVEAAIQNLIYEFGQFHRFNIDEPYPDLTPAVLDAIDEVRKMAVGAAR